MGVLNLRQRIFWTEAILRRDLTDKEKTDIKEAMANNELSELEKEAFKITKRWEEIEKR